MTPDSMVLLGQVLAACVGLLACFRLVVRFLT